MPSIRLAAGSDIDELARLMSVAFFDDPGWSHVLRSERLKSHWLPRLLRAGLEVGLDNGLVWMIRDEQSQEAVSLAIWYPAGCRFPPPWYCTLGPAMKILDFSLFHFLTACRYTALERRMLKLRPAEAKRAWVLAGLATATAHRHGGLATMLVNEGLARATADS